MTRKSIGLIIWGLAISALGLWHIITWVQNADADKGVYKIAVGIFCLFVGAVVILLNLKSGGKGKG